MFNDSEMDNLAEKNDINWHFQLILEFGLTTFKVVLNDIKLLTCISSN